MTRARQSLLLQLDDGFDEDEEAPWSHPKLLLQMATVMWDEHDKKWCARARNCNQFANERSVSAAMQAALDLRDAPKVRPRRRLEE